MTVILAAIFILSLSAPVFALDDTGGYAFLPDDLDVDEISQSIVDRINSDYGEEIPEEITLNTLRLAAGAFVFPTVSEPA